jgi:hypothetical protein
MANTPSTSTPQDRRTGGVAVQAKPHDPKTNTKPRGNGDLEKEDVEKGREKLDRVLTH